ncbi:MAG: type II/IV secretion system protein [Candidatus Colwellbacteria bacterium]|nr:type II/IV secretion system protein [Candidatus Colwellbacteria bacterium]MBI3274176.1 type II/IV secretion system protein [Candidatus Colwellbacteria bacterium]
MALDKSSIDAELTRAPDEISIIKLVDSIVEYAYNSRASDVHIDPTENKVLIRFRIDGVMHDVFTLPKEIQPEIISRIKVLSGLRTDEHHAAQDGRFKFNLDKDKGFDIRVSITPTYYEENAVFRLLAEPEQGFKIDSIGFSKNNLEIIKRAIKKPYGMILLTGPTGSGKTTTLYTILRELNTPEVSIVTIEDPIEYSIEGIEQIQVNPQTGLTFATGLRSVLRQDPNIIMVGEIRDEETAGIAVNAALTGHLLLSTLHTNDAATTLPRLLDMNVEPFLIASTINIAVSQRLVRRICPMCKIKKELTDDEIKSLEKSLPLAYSLKTKVFYQGEGCKGCGGSSYLGRIGIHEVLEMTDDIRKAIMAQKTASEIREIAVGQGMVPILDDGMQKAEEGITSIEEVLRVMHE